MNQFPPPPSYPPPPYPRPGALRILATWLAATFGGGLVGFLVVVAALNVLPIHQASGWAGLGQVFAAGLVVIGCGVVSGVTAATLVAIGNRPVAAVFPAIGLCAIAFVAQAIDYGSDGGGTLLGVAVGVVATVLAIALTSGLAIISAGIRVSPRIVVAFAIVVALLVSGGVVYRLVSSKIAERQNLIAEQQNLSDTEKTWQQVNGGEVWAFPNQRISPSDLQVTDNSLWVPETDTYDIQESHASGSVPVQVGIVPRGLCDPTSCTSVVTPKGNTVWFNVNSDGKPAGTGTYVILGHTDVEIDFGIVDDNQDTALTAAEISQREHVIDQLTRTTIQQLVQ